MRCADKLLTSVAYFKARRLSAPSKTCSSRDREGYREKVEREGWRRLIANATDSAGARSH